MNNYYLHIITKRQKERWVAYLATNEDIWMTSTTEKQAIANLLNSLQSANLIELTMNNTILPLRS